MSASHKQALADKENFEKSIRHQQNWRVAGAPFCNRCPTTFRFYRTAPLRGKERHFYREITSLAGTSIPGFYAPVASFGEVVLVTPSAAVSSVSTAAPGIEY
jgi:hypothetical protein